MHDYKQKAKAYYTAVNECNISKIEGMVDENYIQHNPSVPTGRAAFISFLPRLKRAKTKIENVRMLRDGQHIIMHHLWENAHPFGADTMVAFHIIRFDANGIIAEHWNVMTKFAEHELTKRTLINGPTDIEDIEATATNKSKTKDLFKFLINKRSNSWPQFLHQYFHPNCIQHNPSLGNGINGYVESVQNRDSEIIYHRQHKIFGEGNFILSISEGILNGIPTAFYDLFRFKKGMIAEHWSIYQEIPSDHLANENTMFNFDR